MLSALGLLLIGQSCLNGQCDTSMMIQPSVVQQAPYSNVYPPSGGYSSSPAYQWLKVHYQGLTPYVWGYRLSNGMFRWDTALPANIEQINKAKAVPGGSSATQRFRVTVIGTQAECAPVIRDLATHEMFQDVRSIIDAQDYRPGDWAVSPTLGFNNTGKPSILIQTEDGKAIAQASDYRRGPESLSQVIHQAVRRRDPSYDARKVPDIANGNVARDDIAEDKEPEKKAEEKKPEQKTKASVIPETKDPEPPVVNTPKTCPLGFTKADYPEIAAAGVVIGMLYLKRKRM